MWLEVQWISNLSESCCLLWSPQTQVKHLGTRTSEPWFYTFFHSSLYVVEFLGLLPDVPGKSWCLLKFLKLLPLNPRQVLYPSEACFLICNVGTIMPALSPHRVMVRSRWDTACKTALWAEKLSAIVMQTPMSHKATQCDLGLPKGKIPEAPASTRRGHKSTPPTPVAQLSSSSSREANDLLFTENLPAKKMWKRFHISLGEARPLKPQVYNSLQGSITRILPSCKD